MKKGFGLLAGQHLDAFMWLEQRGDVSLSLGGTLRRMETDLSRFQPAGSASSITNLEDKIKECFK